MKQLHYQKRLCVWIDARRYWACLCLMTLTGCAHQARQVLPDTGPDIKTVYERHISGETGKTIPDPYFLHEDPTPRPGYTREAANEIEQLFPMLPNPRIVLYVYPHFTAKGRPVPGYATAFSLYEKDEYALPGEWIAEHPEAALHE